MPLFWWFIVAGILLLVALFFRVKPVKTSTEVPIERFGNLHRMAKPGWNFYLGILEKPGKVISLRVRNFEHDVKSVTGDGIEVTVHIAAQYFVSNAMKSYRLIGEITDDSIAFLKSYFEDGVRSWIGQTKIIDIFGEGKTNELAQAIKDLIEMPLGEYGLKMKDVQATNIVPDDDYLKVVGDKTEAELRYNAAEFEKKKVIIEAQAKREAEILKAEGEAKKNVILATAEAEAMELRGAGTAKERHQILIGLERSIAVLRSGTPDSINDQDVMMIVLTTEYMRMLEEVGKTPGRTLLMPSSPGEISNLTSQIRNLLVGVAEISRPEEPVSVSAPSES